MEIRWPRRHELVRLFSGRRAVAWWIAGAVALVALSFPLWGGALAGGIVTRKLSSRLGVPIVVETTRAGFTRLALFGVVVGAAEERRPLARIARLEIPFSAAWGGGSVRLEGAHFDVERGGPADNVSDVLARLRGRGAAGEGERQGGGRALPTVVLDDASVRLRDVAGGRTIEIGLLDATVVPNERLTVDAQQVSGRLRVRGGEKDPTFGAASLALEAPLRGLRPVGYPEMKLGEGYVRLLPTLGLTGIQGTIKPASPPKDAGGRPAAAVSLSGSYGGAKETLWTATGTVAGDEEGLDGTVALRAERFSLDKIADVLPPSVLHPHDTSVDAALVLTFASGKVGFKGSLDVTGLNLHHPAVSMEPVIGIAPSVRLDGEVELERRRLELRLFEGRIRDLVGRISGSVELAAGTVKLKDGTVLPTVPKIDLRLQVPRLPCAKLLASVPAVVVPHLAGFVLQGAFEADVFTKIDYENLDALQLGGKVGIDGCRVVKAPEEVTALVGDAPVAQVVEVPKGPPGEKGAVELYAFELGPGNPDFVPYEKISPHLVNSIMTTEDNGFFKHRGWVSPEFKTALKRNLANGGFRLGASSITMQTVKNVLLSREKTLSRKLQELFLVWYLEQLLPKERILELYFNAIEFGPRLYGIGAAARHYFGKAALDLNPLEAAFISSILPSPKRRYIQYCHGALYPPWDKYVRRILARIHERGRLTAEEYETWATQPLVFDVKERPAPEKECLEWVKVITQRPEPESAPETIP